MTKKISARSMLGWLLLAACLALAAVSALGGYHPPARISYGALPLDAQLQPVPVQQGSICVNLADAAALDGLPGIGPGLAQAIVAERAAHGTFFYPEDLMQVRGIGEKKLDGMRQLLDMREE